MPSMDCPQPPKGEHVRYLRDFLGINQTDFGALLGLNQPEVSGWEAPAKRVDLLPLDVAESFLEIWDFFPERPKGGFREIMDELAAYRARMRGPEPKKTDERMVKMVPERHI